MTVLVLLFLAFVTQPAPQAPDYAAMYSKGSSYAEFLDGAPPARATEWRGTTAAATVAEEALDRVKALPDPLRLLVVTEPSCSDSRGTIPYLARLVELSGGRLTLRVVNSKVGRPVMEAHRAGDGRAATPTVVVLDASGALVGAWVERPAPLQKWHEAQNVTNTTRELLPAKMKWYEEDAGRSTIAELVAVLTAPKQPGHP